MSDVEALAQLDRARASRRKIPSGLSFDRLVKNQTASPCSLNDFMDYLIYVEHNAESLQFFLWYCDYVRRWSRLPPKQKELSPVWDSERARKKPRPRFITYSHKTAESEKMNKIITIMDMADRNMRSKDSETGGSREHSRNTSRASLAASGPSRRQSTSSSSSSSASSTASSLDSKEDWPLAQQPFRDEIDQIANHYLSDSGPRRLSLTRTDRESCLAALRQTTHPSALLSAFLVTEAKLKGQLHPDFVHWSMANSNRPRLVFLRLVGAALILLGLGLDAFLILSNLDNRLRVLCIFLLWPGFAILIAAARGVCILLHFRGRRDLNPWEQGSGDDDAGHALDGLELGLPASSSSTAGGHSRKGSGVSTYSALSVFSAFSGFGLLEKKPSLWALGPGNDYDDEPWVRHYARKPAWRKIFETTAPVCSRSLQLLHGRTVFLAVVWGGLPSAALAVGSLFIPSGRLFL